MSQSADKNSVEPLVQPSKFGRRLGIAMAIVFITLAVLAAIGHFAVSENSQSASEPVQSTNPFK